MQEKAKLELLYDQERLPRQDVNLRHDLRGQMQILQFAPVTLQPDIFGDL